MARFIVVDKLIRSSGGHFLEYATRLADGFREAGYEPVLLANNRFKGEKPESLRAVIEFDYDRIVLGADRKAKKAQARTRAKLAAKARRAERLRLSSLGVASAVYHDLLRGGGSRQDRRSMFAALVIFCGVLVTRLLMLLGLVLLWPFKKLFQGLRWFFSRLGSGRAGDWVRARISWAREYAVPSGQLRAAALGVRDVLNDPGGTRGQSNSIAAALDRMKPKPDDILLWTTVKEADLEVALEVARASQAGRAPVWHFIFREPIFLNEGPHYLTGQQHRGLRSKLLELAAIEGLRFGWWCDTEELAEQYSTLGAGAFGVLPVVMPESLAVFAEEGRVTEPEPGAKVTLGYFGDARPEKGYGILPELLSALSQRKRAWNERTLGVIRTTRDLEAAQSELDRSTLSLRETLIRRRRVRMAEVRVKAASEIPDRLSGAPEFGLLAQSNFNVPDGSALTRSSRYRLLARDDIGAEIYTTPPPSEGYVANFGRSDVVVLNYTHPLYRAGSSGVFAEAILAGKPVLVTDQTWGGRRLRTAPGYVQHLSDLIDKQPGVWLSGDPASVMAASPAWVLPPSSSTHLALRVRFADLSVTDQLKAVVNIRIVDGSVITRERNLCNRLATAVAVIRLPEATLALNVKIERLNPRLTTDDFRLEMKLLRHSPEDGPLCAIGMIIGDANEALDATVEMGRHFAHYRRTASVWSADWQEEHLTRHAVERIVSISEAAGSASRQPQ